MAECSYTLGVLLAARAKIADPKNWTPHGRELGRNGQPPYCMVTACALAAELSMVVSRTALEALEAQTGGMGLVQFNTERGHAAVLDCFDRAIAELA